MSKKLKNFVFWKTTSTILIKCCGSKVHSNLNNMTLSAIHGKSFKLKKIIFEKIEMFNFCLMWTTLHFEGRMKKKETKIKKENERQEILQGDSRYRIWTRLVSWFRRYVTWQKIKNYFSSFKDFPGKADSVILLGFECTINTQNLNNIPRAIFEKIEILNFFLMWTTLNFGGSSKTERTGRRYLQGDSRYRIWARLVSWFRCYFTWRTEN